VGLSERRSKLLRVGCISVLGLIFAWGVLLVSVQARERVVRFRSEALYSEFLKLRPGVTTKTDVQLLRKQWAGKLSQNVNCNGDQCDYTIGDIWGLSRWFLLTRFAHDHAPSFMLQIETKGNYVLRATFSARVMVPTGYGTREERKFLSNPNYVSYASDDFALIGHASLIASLPGGGDGPLPMPARGYRALRINCMNCLAVRVAALPSVAQETRAQLFRFDFGCMTRWAVCTDKEDLMPRAAREEAAETASDDEIEEMQRKCMYRPEVLAAAANDAVEIQVLGEPSSNGSVSVKVLRYIGGTRPLRVGQEMTLEVSRSNDASTALQQAREAGGRMVVLYPGASYGVIYPYDQCGLLPDGTLETVSRNFELQPN
jgi:hypothetical protein